MMCTSALLKYFKLFAKISSESTNPHLFPILNLENTLFISYNKVSSNRRM